MSTPTRDIVVDQSPQLGHTPGPWHVEPAPSPSSMKSIRAENGKAVAFVNRGAAAEANERLIADAPELLNIARLAKRWAAALAELKEEDEESEGYIDASSALFKSVEGWREP